MYRLFHRQWPIVVLSFVSSLAQAPEQSGPSSKSEFEVVSVKPAPPMPSMAELVASGGITKDGYIIDGPNAIGVHITDVKAALRGVPLSLIIQMAYRLPADQITGPAWLADARFDVIGKLAAGSSKDDVPQMLQAMLRDRFKIAVHHEEKVRPVYLLVVGKGSLRLKQSSGGKPEQDGCQGGRGGHHACQKVTMEDLAQFLSRGTRATGMVATAPGWLDRPVIDKTGLKGTYDFTMDYGPVGTTGGRNQPADDSMTVPISEAVKALGLNLEPSRQPFDVLVLDHIERVPTEN